MERTNPSFTAFLEAAGEVFNVIFYFECVCKVPAHAQPSPARTSTPVTPASTWHSLVPPRVTLSCLHVALTR